ncbi:MAG: DinB family protein [Chloroflexota bacterium]|nr:DinB family protein [Chloroflexota bacterium]
MSSKSEYETLFAYSWHTSDRLLEGAAKLSVADYIETPHYGQRSLHGLFFHMLTTLRGYRLAFETGHQPSPLDPEDYPDLSSIRTAYRQEQAAWQELLESWSPEDYTGVANLTRLGGQTMSMPRWRILQQIVMHNMQHHTEVAQILTNHGESPGDIDFLFYR